MRQIRHPGSVLHANESEFSVKKAIYRSRKQTILVNPFRVTVGCQVGISWEMSWWISLWRCLRRQVQPSGLFPCILAREVTHIRGLVHIDPMKGCELANFQKESVSGNTPNAVYINPGLLVEAFTEPLDPVVTRVGVEPVRKDGNALVASVTFSE